MKRSEVELAGGSKRGIFLLSNARFCILSNSFLTYSAFTMLHLKKGKINSFCCFSRPNYGYNLTEVSNLPNFIDTSMHPEGLPFLKMTAFYHENASCMWLLYVVMAIDSCLQLLYVSARD